MTIARRNTWFTDILFLAFAGLVFYTLWLGRNPLFIPDEGRYSEVAREMVATGDYITPRLNGIVFLDKPILYYWLQATAIQLFGVKEWAIRLFPALTGILGILITYISGRRIFDRLTGIIAAIILGTTPLYFGCAHYANLDLEVAVFISSALLCFFTGINAHDHSRHYFLYAAYIFSAIGFLTKGLIGIAFPAMISLIWLTSTKRLKELKQIHLIGGLALFLIITLPWYILAQRANPEFLHFFFINQQILRFLSAGTFNNPSPIWFYIPIVIIGFLPWTVFVIPAIYRSFKDRHSLFFFLIWASFVFIFFSIPSSKVISYILPIFPPLALIVGNYIAMQWRTHKKVFQLCTIFSVLLLLFASYYAVKFNQDTAKPLVTELQPLLKPQDEVVHYFKFYQDVPLYLQRRVTLVANWSAPDIAQKDNWVRELWYGMPFQDTRDWLINENTFWQRFNGPNRLFVFVNINYFDQFKSRASHYYVLAKHNDIILLCNKPIILAKKPGNMLYL